ncbi:MAG: AEC family transporter [Oscillospiraceae bacterium]
MIEIFSKILCMLSVIVIGFFLKKIGIVSRDDFHVLSKILIYVTIPASVIVNFNGFEMEYSMLILPVLAIVFFLVGCLTGTQLVKGGSREDKAFMVLNASAFNTGAFTMAFIQALLPSICVVTVMIFDIGNCTSTAVLSYIIASAILEGGKARLSLKYIIHELFRSFVFMMYLTLTIMSMLHIGVPEIILAPARLIAPANVFIAMLAVGVGMEINIQPSERTLLIKALIGRYAVAVVLALISWFLLPFGHDIRLAMTLVAFSPATAFGAMHTATLGGNYALSNTFISVSILISTAIMTVLVLLLI